MGDRKRDGDDLYNERSSPRRWEPSHTNLNRDIASLSATMGLARQLEQQQRENRFLTSSSGASRFDDETYDFSSSTQDRINEVYRLRQEIAIQERLLAEALEREQRLRSLQQQQHLVNPYYGARGETLPSSNDETNMAESIRRLERELELSRLARSGGTMLEPSNPISDLERTRTSHEGERRALQRMIALHREQEDPRQRLLEELRLQDSLIHPGSASLQGLMGGTIDGRNLLTAQSLLRSDREAPPPVSRPRKKGRAHGPRPPPPTQTGPSVPVIKKKVISMTLPSDVTSLSKYQATIRSGLEFFTADRQDAKSVVQGRKKRIRLYQVGIRCKFCAKMPLKDRSTGAVYFPASMASVYQAAQNVASVHMLAERKTKTGACSLIPKEFQKELEDSKNVRAGSLVGKVYWAESCKDLGIAEEDGGLWFPESLNTEVERDEATLGAQRNTVNAGEKEDEEADQEEGKKRVETSDEDQGKSSAEELCNDEKESAKGFKTEG